MLSDGNLTEGCLNQSSFDAVLLKAEDTEESGVKYKEGTKKQLFHRGGFGVIGGVV